jgi:hypothetical protein
LRQAKHVTADAETLAVWFDRALDAGSLEHIFRD